MLPMFEKKKIAAGVVMRRKKTKDGEAPEYETEGQTVVAGPKSKAPEDKQNTQKVNNALNR